MQDCIFCKIINKEIPSEIVFEDEKVLAFKDVNPIAPTHILLIPKKHIPTLLDLSDDDKKLIGHLHIVASKIAKEFGLEKEGFRLVNNCLEGAGQSVFHLHFHLIGGRLLNWPPG